MKNIVLAATLLCSLEAWAQALPPVECDESIGWLGHAVGPQFPEGEGITLSQAVASMKAYYNTWNKVAEKARRGTLTTADLDLANSLFAEDASLELHDTGILVSPAIPVPGTSGGTLRSDFVDYYLQGQPGSVHKPTRICVLGNRIFVEGTYSVPSKRHGLPLLYALPQLGASIHVPFTGNYEITDGKVSFFSLHWDLYRFLKQSADYAQE